MPLTPVEIETLRLCERDWQAQYRPEHVLAIDGLKAQGLVRIATVNTDSSTGRVPRLTSAGKAALRGCGDA